MRYDKVRERSGNMAIFLKDLLHHIQRKYELTCVTGEESLWTSTNVTWIYYMEDVTTLDFIRGGELVITTGMRCNEEQWLMYLIEQATKNKASGVIINVGQYITAVSETVIQLANEKKLPIFTMPWKMHIVDLTQDICNLILVEKQKEFDVKKVFSSFFLKGTVFDKELLTEQIFFDHLRYCIIKGEKSINQENFSLEDNALEAMERNVKQMLSEQLAAVCKWNVVICEKKLEAEDSFYPSKEKCTHIEIYGFLQLSQQKSDKEMIQFIKQKLTNQNEIIWGIGKIKTSFDEMKEAKEEAKYALIAGKLQHRVVEAYEESGIYQILLQVKDQKVLKDMYQEKLGVLEAFPEDERNMYLDTLRNYIECGGSIKEVASRSFLHRNTVNYRMKKIKEILSVSLEDEQERFMLWVCFYIRDMLEGKSV